jgi:uncharacterized protein YchJ
VRIINTNIKECKKDMAMLGTNARPIIVKVKTEERASEIAQICDENGWVFIAGLEPIEDITDLIMALKQKETPADVYSPCQCGSGKKYKFCCAKKTFKMPL